MEINPKDVRNKEKRQDPYDFKIDVVHGFKNMCKLFSQCSLGQPKSKVDKMNGINSLM